MIGFGQQLVWSSHTTISSNLDGYGRPRIVLTENKSPLIIWRKDSSPKVLRASKWNGSTFSGPYDILEAGIIPSSWDGPEIIAKGDTVYVVFTSTATTQSSIMLIKSFDGGLTFSDTIRVSENDQLHKYRMANIAINEYGNPVVSYMKYLLNWSDPKQMVNTSLTFGNNFLGENDGSILAPGEPCDCCKSSLICKGDNVYLLFRNNDSNARNSYISKSIDGGLTFILSEDTDDYNWMLNSCPSTTPKGIILGDSLCVVKRSGSTGNNEIVYSNINSNDLSYSYNNNLDFIAGVLQDYPEISSNGDTIVIVWQDNRTGIQNCYMSYSSSGTNNFSESISISDSNSIGVKLYPDVAYANGEIHLVYLDYNENSIIYTKAYFSDANNISELNHNHSKNIVKIVDVKGNKVHNIKNQPFLYIYDDGTVEKKIIIE